VDLSHHICDLFQVIQAFYWYLANVRCLCHRFQGVGCSNPGRHADPGGKHGSSALPPRGKGPYPTVDGDFGGVLIAPGSSTSHPGQTSQRYRCGNVASGSARDAERQAKAQGYQISSPGIQPNPSQEQPPQSWETSSLAAYVWKQPHHSAQRNKLTEGFFRY